MLKVRFPGPVRILKILCGSEYITRHLGPVILSAQVAVHTASARVSGQYPVNGFVLEADGGVPRVLLSAERRLSRTSGELSRISHSPTTTGGEPRTWVVS